jgi:flagellar motor switch protein FliN/FliY
MTEAVEYEQFDQDSPGHANAGDADLNRLSEIPMELAVEIGRTAMTVGETLQLRVGTVVELERQAGEPADLLVNGTAIARGEVVVIDERYGLRITEIIEGQQEPHGAPAEEPYGVTAEEPQAPAPEQDPAQEPAQPGDEAPDAG